MKSLFAAAGAAAVLATAWGLSGEAALEDEPFAAADAAGRMQFSLQLAGVDRGCSLSKGVELANGVSQLSVGPLCDKLVPELAQARTWRENADGTVTIADADGGALLEFAVADGLAYESFRAGAPLVSLMVR